VIKGVNAKTLTENQYTQDVDSEIVRICEIKALLPIQFDM